MYTSIVLAALTGSLVASSSHESLTWHKDYYEAKQIGQTDKKPLAVFIGSGAGGQTKVCQDGKLADEVEKLLGDNYVCVYVDASTPEGQKLTSAFGNTEGTGLVLSDRTGEKQAFAHQGNLSTADLTRWVKKFADPNVLVNTTVTNASSQMSMYPSNGSMMNYTGNVIYGSQGYFSNGVIYGGGGCPGGNCGMVIRRR
jgi:hypothetical protein